MCNPLLQSVTAERLGGHFETQHDLACALQPFVPSLSLTAMASMLPKGLRQQIVGSNTAMHKAVQHVINRCNAQQLLQLMHPIMQGLVSAKGGTACQPLAVLLACEQHRNPDTQHRP